ncbi:MAG: hypothetical protein ACO1SX_27185 [Actinomycetota bacterium]
MTRDPRQYCGWCPAHSDAPPECHAPHCPRYPRRESGGFWWVLLAAVLLAGVWLGLWCGERLP